MQSSLTVASFNLNLKVNNFMNIVALVTGRGNNTLKNKNILHVFGKPLMHYPCLAAKKSKYIKHFFISSDDEKILECGYNEGFTKQNRLSIQKSCIAL